MTIIAILIALAAIVGPLIVGASSTAGKLAGDAASSSESKTHSKTGFLEGILEFFKGLIFQNHGDQGQINLTDDSVNGAAQILSDEKDQQMANSIRSFLDTMLSYTDVQNPGEGNGHAVPADWSPNPYGNAKTDTPNNGYGTYTDYTPSSAQAGVSTGTSAQVNDQTSPSATAIANQISNGDNGSGGQNASQTVDWIKQLLISLGLGDFLNQKEYQGWDYDSIVNDERKYGQGMIADARRWEEYMSSTAYQRAVKDIQDAGLNPWLAVQSGSLSPANWGSVDSGSALGSISTSLSQSLSNSNSNSSSAIVVALIMMIAKMFMS